MSKVVFRADARVDLGTGHVMRCVTLGRHLQADGWEVNFVTTEESLRLCPDLKYFPNIVLSPEMTLSGEIAVLQQAAADVIVIDHYERDASLESPLREVSKIFIIDDLANRTHDCHALLDQTPGRQPPDYAPWVPQTCIFYLGGDYALLRPEFAELRSLSLARRQNLEVPRTILVTCGGTDPKGASLVVLEALNLTHHPFGVTLILPRVSPYFQAVQERIETWVHPSTVTLLERTSDMAELMVNADIAIGAGGTTSWERCCLGLPCLNLKVADNQAFINQVLGEKGAVIDLGEVENLDRRELARKIDGLAQESQHLHQMTLAASKQVDGLGCVRVGQVLRDLLCRG